MNKKQNIELTTKLKNYENAEKSVASGTDTALQELVSSLVKETVQLEELCSRLSLILHRLDGPSELGCDNEDCEKAETGTLGELRNVRLRFNYLNEVLLEYIARLTTLV